MLFYKYLIKFYNKKVYLATKLCFNKMLKCKKDNNIFAKFNQINSATSDQNLIIYGSLDSSCQGASDRSIYMSLGLMDGELFAFYCF